MKPPSWLNSFSVDDISDSFNNVVFNLNMDASPGVPYAMLARTNGELFKTYKDLLLKMVIDRIQRIRALPIDDDVRENVDNLLVDPVRVFVKQEPHQAKKVREKRWRLIFSVSIVDKIIEAMLYGTMNQWMISNWRNIPPKPGMGFSWEDNQFVYKHVNNMRAPVSTDVSGWDWSVQRWMLEADNEFRSRVYQLSGPSREFSRKFAELQMHSVYQFSDGSMRLLTIPWMQNSGRYTTSSSNSVMRAIVARLVGSDECITMGDDCIENYVPDAFERYKRLGVELKVYDDVVDQFEFCSRLYRDRISWPLNTGKSLMVLLSHDVSDVYERFALQMQFEDQYASSPDWDELVRLLQRVGWYA
jgi:hypothetical protein